MKLYRCFIEGKNFPLEVDGQEGPVGFYTTRFVRADSPENAEILALEMLRSDPSLDVEPAKRRKDTQVLFESISEIDSIPEGCDATGTGFVFFPMGT
jgi:hypothetical protein